jgi:hypothetical protein
VSWEQLGYYRFVLCTQGTFCSRPRGITLIEPTQIRWFSRWSCGGGWSSRAIAQRRSRILKLGFKGLSIGAARHGSNWAELTATLTGNLLRGESWITALNLTELGQKAAGQKNTSLLIRRSYSIFLGWKWRREFLMTLMMIMSVNKSSQSEVHVTAFVAPGV